MIISSRQFVCFIALLGSSLIIGSSKYLSRKLINDSKNSLQFSGFRIKIIILNFKLFNLLATKYNPQLKIIFQIILLTVEFLPLMNFHLIFLPQSKKDTEVSVLILIDIFLNLNYILFYLRGSNPCSNHNLSFLRSSNCL